MSEVESAATELKTQYAAQVAGDLERNVREQERIGAEVAALEEQLRALRHDQSLLAELQRALGGGGSAQSGADTEKDRKDQKDQKGKEDTARSAAPAPSVPRQASAATTARKRKKPATTKAAATKTATTKPAAKSAAARTTAKSTAAKPTATKAAATKSATTKSATESTASKPADSAGSVVSTDSVDSVDAKAAAPKHAAAESASAKSAAAKSAPVKPTLVELIREHLGRQSEPRSSAEIATALAEAHPEREIKPKVVRTTVEGLVAKGQVQRTKQGSSVFYTASGSTPAPTGAAADAATEQAPETA